MIKRLCKGEDTSFLELTERALEGGDEEFLYNIRTSFILQVSVIHDMSGEGEERGKAGEGSFRAMML